MLAFQTDILEYWLLPSQWWWRLNNDRSLYYWFRKADFTKSSSTPLWTKMEELSFVMTVTSNLAGNTRSWKFVMSSSGLQGLFWTSIPVMCLKSRRCLKSSGLFSFGEILFMYTSGIGQEENLSRICCLPLSVVSPCLGQGEVGTLLISHKSVWQFEGRQRKNLSNYAIGIHISVHWKQNVQNMQLPDSTKNSYKLELRMVKLNFSAK